MLTQEQASEDLSCGSNTQQMVSIHKDIPILKEK
jgi:hypothetical protein